MQSCFKSRWGFRGWAFIDCASIIFHSSFISILQSRKTMVSCSDWWFLNSALCGWKDHSGMPVPSFTQWADLVSCWSISLNSGLPRLSLCVSLFGKCLFGLREALLHCLPPTWTLMSMPKAFSSLLRTSLKRNWGLPMGRFLELILRKGNPLGSGHHPFSQHGQARANDSVSGVFTSWEFQLVSGLCSLEHCLARWCWVCVVDLACGKC